MGNYKIREIDSRSKSDIRKFVVFPDKLYASCPQYVPALHSDQVRSLTDCAPLHYCDLKLWVAEDANGKMAGRIAGMINPRYNELYNKKRARFGWFDTIDDFEVASLLLSTAEAWAKEKGMDEIHGPLYYNTLGKQGMLVEGFDHVPVFNTLYNFKYYNDFVEKLGYEKEFDWLEYKVPADQGVPEKMRRMCKALMERYNLHECSVDKLKNDPAKVREFFEKYNESFSQTVNNFVPFNEEEMKEEAESFLPYLSDKTCVIVLDENEELVAFGITVPDISAALQKAKGSLWPFGWYHLKKALGRYETMDLMINGAVPKWQNTGISSILHTKMSEKYEQIGAKWAYTNPQIESNGAVNVWSRYGNELHMRRRCYLKKI